MQTYIPVKSAFNGIYVMEKIGTKWGWAPSVPDEVFFTAFLRRKRPSTAR
jgi:hypothetical protein